MVNIEMISQVKEVLQRGNLENLRACYMEYSNDWDAQTECREFEERICVLQDKARSMGWTQEVYALAGESLSSAAAAYFALAELLDSMVKEADELVAADKEAHERACQERACEMDNRIREFLARELSLSWCDELPRLYKEMYGLPRDIKQYSECIGDLELAYKKRDTTERAARFDDSVERLDRVMDVNVRLSSAEALLRDYNSFSAEGRGLCKKRGALEDILQACCAEIDRIRTMRRAEAEVIDELYDSFEEILSNERICQARAFIKKYNSTSAEIRAFCRRATDTAIKKFEARLDQNQRENDLRAKAKELDRRFSALFPVRRERACFSKAEAMVAEIRSTSAEILRFCHEATEKAADHLESTVKAEKRYLDHEERIRALSSEKTHTKEWCQRVRALVKLVSGDVDRCGNGQLLREMNKEADRIDIELVCAPYLKALDPNSDFKTVLELDSTLKSFAERAKLEAGIPSFMTKWQQRVDRAYGQKKQNADKLYEQAMVFHNQDQFSRAFPLFMEADKEGNLEAAYYLGQYYGAGNCVLKDLGKAKSYLQKAADNGDEYAMSDLADIYREENNASVSFYWRKRAVAAGYENDAMCLAKMYYEGEGTARNYQEAYKMFQELTKRSLFSSEANAYLGLMCENGWGVSKNEERALEHYKEGSSIPWVKEAYDRLFQKLDGERRDLEIKQNFERANAGEPWAQYFIGWCYYNGYRMEKNYRMALYFLEKAARGGVGKAMALLGDMYYNGEGVEADRSKAKAYYSDALRHGEQ